MHGVGSDQEVDLSRGEGKGRCLCSFPLDTSQPGVCGMSWNPSRADLA